MLFYKGKKYWFSIVEKAASLIDGDSGIKAISGLHDIPIAFFTSSDDPKDILHAREIGAVDYIKKPYEKNDLLKRMGKII